MGGQKRADTGRMGHAKGITLGRNAPEGLRKGPRRSAGERWVTERGDLGNKMLASRTAPKQRQNETVVM